MPIAAMLADQQLVRRLVGRLISEMYAEEAGYHAFVISVRR